MTSKKKQPKYKKAPQAPRRFKSSYMFFSTFKHKEIRKELNEEAGDTKISTTEIAKRVSKAWKDMSHTDREEWEEMARQDKARYKMEKTMYSGPWKVLAKKRSLKDPEAPKRPMSAFLSFSNSRRGKVKSENPNAKNAEVSRILAQMWKDAPEKERKEHIDKEYKLRQEYKVAMAEWKKKSESEMEALQKAREDEAIKAVAAVDGNDTDFAKGATQLQAQQFPNPYAYHSNLKREGLPISPGSAYPYYSPSSTGLQNAGYTHNYYNQHGLGSHASPHTPAYPNQYNAHGSHYDRGPSYYDGYGQTYPQVPFHSQPQGPSNVEPQYSARYPSGPQYGYEYPSHNKESHPLVGGYDVSGDYGTSGDPNAPTNPPSYNRNSS